MRLLFFITVYTTRVDLLLLLCCNPQPRTTLLPLLSLCSFFPFTIMLTRACEVEEAIYGVSFISLCLCLCTVLWPSSRRCLSSRFNCIRCFCVLSFLPLRCAQTCVFFPCGEVSPFSSRTYPHAYIHIYLVRSLGGAFVGAAVSCAVLLSFFIDAFALTYIYLRRLEFIFAWSRFP